jgi:hypothetical protein
VVSSGERLDIACRITAGGFILDFGHLGQCPASEVRGTLRQPLTRTSEAKGH